MPKIIRFHAHVTVTHYKKIVFRVLSQLAKIVHLVARSKMRNIGYQAYRAGREIGAQFFDDWNNGVASVGDRKDHLILWIIEAAKTGKILVGLMVQSANRFYDTGGRHKRHYWSRSSVGAAEMGNHTIKGK